MNRKTLAPLALTAAIAAVLALPASAQHHAGMDHAGMKHAGMKHAAAKTEPVFVAIMGFLFLADPLTAPMGAAILIAVAGVALISFHKREGLGNARVAMLGLGSGFMFAISAIGYRGAILSLHMPGYVLPATISLATGLALQTLLLLAWLLLFQRQTLRALLRLWRPSLAAGFAGAAASECWFLAFALATAASVRTLALVEVLFAQGVSRFLFRQKTNAREAVGIALLLAGAALIVWLE